MRDPVELLLPLESISSALGHALGGVEELERPDSPARLLELVQELRPALEKLRDQVDEEVRRLAC